MAAAGFNGSKMVEIIALTAQCILISGCFELPNPWDVGYAPLLRRRRLQVTASTGWASPVNTRPVHQPDDA
jgi:hypothetical protein